MLGMLTEDGPARRCLFDQLVNPLPLLVGLWKGHGLFVAQHDLANDGAFIALHFAAHVAFPRLYWVNNQIHDQRVLSSSRSTPPQAVRKVCELQGKNQFFEGRCYTSSHVNLSALNDRAPNGIEGHDPQTNWCWCWTWHHTKRKHLHRRDTERRWLLQQCSRSSSSRVCMSSFTSNNNNKNNKSWNGGKSVGRWTMPL